MGYRYLVLRLYLSLYYSIDYATTEVIDSIVTYSY